MTEIDLDAATQRIALLVEQVLADQPAVPSLAVALRTSDGRTAHVTQGVADPSTGEPLMVGHAYRIASCTKTFVAVTVMSLVADGLVALDQPVIEVVPGEVADLLARFDAGRVTTVQHLLQHRSGLVDHTNFPEFGAEITSTWTPVRQLAIAVDRPGLFAPGSAFSYSDSGYVMLGQVIEHLDGRPLASAVRARAEIDAERTPSLHWELLEPSPAGLRRAHQLFEGADTHDWSPTFDLFGGGGLVSTLDDLCTWWSGWFAGEQGRVASHLADVAPTLGPDGVTQFPGGDRVGFGVFGREVSGRHLWSHGGFWGLETGHVPDLGVSYALSLTNRAPGIPAPHAIGTAVVQALV